MQNQKKIYLELIGNPVPKARPVVCRNGAFDKQDKIKRSTKFELLVQRKKYENEFKFPINLPLHVDFIFHLKTPEKLQTLASWHIPQVVTKPDIDNLAKFYMDCLNEIFYEDDRQIISSNIKKVYSIQPKTEIIIMPVEKTISMKTEEILQMINCSDFLELVDDLAMVADTIDTSMLYGKRIDLQIQTDAAHLISLFADRYALCLMKIKKKHSLLHKEIEEMRISASKILPQIDEEEDSDRDFPEDDDDD